jgi:hypothetical protein
VEKRIWIVIAGILLTSVHSIPLANAQFYYHLTSLTIAVPSQPQGKECTIAVTLIDENDTPLHNMNIDFYFCGTSKIGTATTNSTGEASLTYTMPETGTYRINAKFSGTANYARSSSDYVYIVVMDYAPFGSFLVGGGILAAVAIIGVTGYNFFRKRESNNNNQ